MNSRWVREFDTAVTLDAGYFAAAKSEKEPQPQPSSRMSWPDDKLARWQYRSVYVHASHTE